MRGSGLDGGGGENWCWAEIGIDRGRRGNDSRERSELIEARATRAARSLRSRAATVAISPPATSASRAERGRPSAQAVRSWPAEPLSVSRRRAVTPLGAIRSTRLGVVPPPAVSSVPPRARGCGLGGAPPRREGRARAGAGFFAVGCCPGRPWAAEDGRTLAGPPWVASAPACALAAISEPRGGGVPAGRRPASDA